MHEHGSPSKRIADELLSWPGVDAGPHRFGGLEGIDLTIRLMRRGYKRARARSGAVH